jgi:hypothetical protein
MIAGVVIGSRLHNSDRPERFCLVLLSEKAEMRLVGLTPNHPDWFGPSAMRNNSANMAIFATT